ncbi:MAG: sigma-70 family RNA polymerase sigma factor [Thermomicrobiales bacterium]
MGDRRSMENEDDAILAIRSRHDRAAFALLYDRYVASVYHYCYRLLGNRQAAEDATGETFTKALAGLNRFDPHSGNGSFRGWLFTIAHHAAMDTLRRRPAPSLANGWETADPDLLPEERIVAEESARELHAALSTLTDDQCTVMLLRLAGLSAPEIAQVLSRTPQAIKSTQFRAITQLRQRLQSQSPHPPSPVSDLTEPSHQDHDAKEGIRAGHA